MHNSYTGKKTDQTNVFWTVVNRSARVETHYEKNIALFNDEITFNKIARRNSLLRAR